MDMFVWMNAMYAWVLEEQNEGMGSTEAGGTSGVSCPVWVLGPELGSSGRAGRVLNCWAISLAFISV